MDYPQPNLNLARNVILTEARCVGELTSRIDERFAAAATAIFRCQGTVILTGVGKAGIIANKISATLASTGTPSIFLHPVEALHGDLGRVRADDVVVALSHSGATEETVRLLDHLKARGAALIAITSRLDSPLGKYAEIALCYGEVEEACPLGLAPSASTSCMLALGDALALTVMDMRKFSPEEFAAFHPGGQLGRKLLRVEELMTVQGDRLPLAPDNMSVREVLQQAEKVSRRPGALLLVDAQGRLTGILTDADLRRRLLSESNGNLLDRPVGEVMIRQPKCIQVGELASHALAILNKFRIDELPVVDADHKPVGMLDVQDLVGLKTVNHAQE